MKRLIPVIAAICLIGAILCVLPKNSDYQRTVISSLDDLNGLKVGVQVGTNYDQYLLDVAPDAIPVIFSEFSSMYPAIQQGKVDALLTETISFTVEKFEYPSFVAVEEPVLHLCANIGASKTPEGYKALSEVNEFLAKMKADGSFDEMYDRWFTNYDRTDLTIDRSGITGKNGVLNVTAEASFEPTCFAGEGGELTGYAIDFLYRFCREYGYEPNVTPLSYDVMTAALSSGKYTLALGVIADEERAEEIDFSDEFMPFDLIAIYDTGSKENKSFLVNLSESFYKTFIKESRWKMFLTGAETTLLISSVSVICGTAIGLLLYQWVMHGKEAEKKFTGILCWLCSSTPTIVLLMILYYVVFSAFLISGTSVAIVGFSVIFGCGFYELLVTGVKAVGKGQEEAARAQGFTENQTFFKIIFPQAVEHIYPSYQGNIISLIQDTSVVGYIAVMDLTKMSDLVRGRTYEAFFPLLSTAAIYFLIIWIITIAISRFSVVFDSKSRSRNKILKDIKEK